jgi:hypothetical protein
MSGILPMALTLQRGDLARAWQTESAHAVSNAAAAHDGPPGFAALLRRWGRLGGYRVEFTRAATAKGLQEGALAIQSSASVYRTAAGAHAAFAYDHKHLVPRGTARIALGFRLGDEASEYVSQNASGVGDLLEYTLVWRERNVLASLVVIGRVGVVSAADVAPLARSQDRRIRRSLP